MKNLKMRLDSHFVAAAAVAAVAAVGAQANAGVVYSGVVNLATSTSINGLYLNVVTGQINEPGNTGGGTVPGWDLNIYGGTQTWYSFQPGGQWGYVGTGTSTLAQLLAGAVIDGSTINLTNSANGSAFPTDAPGALFGFRFTNEGTGQVNYGWGRYYRPAGAAGVLVDYAYEDSGAGIAAGAVPAPGALALIGLGGLVAGRRRR